MNNNNQYIRKNTYTSDRVLIIIGVLNNGLVLLNVDTFWQDVARGTLLIVAVTFDQIRERWSIKNK